VKDKTVKWFLKLIVLTGISFLISGWGFFSHQKINRLAVFILPPEMIGFYKKNIHYISEAAVNPDRRRYSVPDEGCRHYIDWDDYGDSAAIKLPHAWNDAVKKFGEDSLKAHGILPWHIVRMYDQLKDAFMVRDPEKILRLSAELGHYVADANVPLHTTGNYDGQKTNQNGIHAFWESRLPELYFDEYDFLVGKAEYLSHVQARAWEAVTQSHNAVDSVLSFERILFKQDAERKFNFETKGRQTVKVISPEYAKTYHRMLSGMVERRFRASVKMTGDIWYTAWVDAGQPDLKLLIRYRPTEEELKKRVEELKTWKEKRVRTRAHESDGD
jgi:hypothetical protein